MRKVQRRGGRGGANDGLGGKMEENQEQQGHGCHGLPQSGEQH